MSTEQALTMIERHSVELSAIRLALIDLAVTLPAELRGEWLSNLHSRIAKMEKVAGENLLDATPATKELASALEFLHANLSRR